MCTHAQGFPGGPEGKESAHNAGDTRDTSSIPGWGEPLKEGMATHSSILVWRIPWTEELSGLWSIGVKRVAHDQSNLAHIAVLYHKHVTL